MGQIRIFLLVKEDHMKLFKNTKLTKETNNQINRFVKIKMAANNIKVLELMKVYNI